MYAADVNVNEEQRSLLEKHSFTLRPLASAGKLDGWALFRFAVSDRPLAIFVFSLLVLTMNPRLHNEAEVWWFHRIGSIVLIFYPACAACVLVAGIVAARMQSPLKWSSAVYWAWWPIWKFVICAAALSMGTALGNYIWINQFFPYHYMAEMQAYSNVDPYKVSGMRLQDAGIVLFNTTVGVDRSRTGCLMDGNKYCVAPLVSGGDVLSQNPSDGLHDIFFAGINCCTCPGEFRCGAWDEIDLADVGKAPLGGLRVIAPSENEYFRLAAMDWAATYGKSIKHPLFLTWVEDAPAAWNDLRTHAVKVMLSSLVSAPLVLLAVAFVLNRALVLLTSYDLAVPIDGPLLPTGSIGRVLSEKFVPDQMSRQQQQQQQGADATA